MSPSSRFFRKTLGLAGASLALAAFFATPALATVPVPSPGINLVQLVAQVNALNSKVATLQNTVTTLQNTVNSQAATIAGLQKVTSPLTLSGKPGTFPATLTISGVNVQIVNGLGATNGSPNNPLSAGSAVVNGLGNLILGYNESRSQESPRFFDTRTGSHNLILGDENDYSSYGGFVGGNFNSVAGAYASIISGGGNSATGQLSVVINGTDNQVDSLESVILDGDDNLAKGIEAVLIGGNDNFADGTDAVVVGGFANHSSGMSSVVSGGSANLASGEDSVVIGGSLNIAGDPRSFAPI